MAIPITSDPYDVLLAHNLWGTREILKVCARLTPEQFSRSFPVGPAEKGGLHATLTHIIGAMGRWSDRIAGRPVRPFLGTTDNTLRTTDQLDAILQEHHNALAALAPNIRADPSRLVHLEFGGKPYTFAAGAAYVHVLTHGHYHHAQCINILRHLAIPGISTHLPELDVTDWQATSDMRD
ncbi:MAG: hypothetical protein KF805_09350 [Phycisphaeraceae bacterium]|nr:hypothetical protein [Phycisphaeraceae bacterium]